MTPFVAARPESRSLISHNRCRASRSWANAGASISFPSSRNSPVVFPNSGATAACTMLAAAFSGEDPVKSRVRKKLSFIDSEWIALTVMPLFCSRYASSRVNKRMAVLAAPKVFDALKSLSFCKSSRLSGMAEGAVMFKIRANPLDWAAA